MTEGELQSILYRYHEKQCMPPDDVIVLLEEVRRLEADRERWRQVIREAIGQVRTGLINIPTYHLEKLLGEK